MNRCKGCAEFRRLVEPEWESCKRRPLCKVADVSLLATLHESTGKRVALSHERGIAETIERNLIEATRYAVSSVLPLDGEAFRTWLLGAHGLLFADCGLDFGGRFRRHGELGYFGGDGRHQRSGSPVDRIEADLDALAAAMFQGMGGLAQLNREDFLSCSANFLERFFSIHPFVDGNGRIGRLFLKAVAMGTGKFMYAPFTNNSRARRRYVSALQLAHARAKNSKSLAALIDWLDPYLAEWQDSETLSEAEPTSSALSEAPRRSPP